MPFTTEQIKHLHNGANDFVYFVNEIFSSGMKNFVKGEYINSTARFMCSNDRTIRISARNHFKSFVFYAYFMWKMLYEGIDNDIEAHYFSFNSDLAAYHIGKIKNLIIKNPFFSDIIDKKTAAESVLKYTWDNKNFITLEPHGLVSFKRGIHADLIFVDDPFQDPENELNPTVIFKINEIFKSNILDMPHEQNGELHVVGTPQTNDDFFFDPSVTKRFSVRIQPAITEEGKALWPEWMSLEELKKKREERTERIFKREYMCMPVHASSAFFDRDYFKKQAINENLINLKARLQYKPIGDVVAGFDIGKKINPSHLSVFEYVFDEIKQIFVLRMIHHKFMDGWSYSNGKHFFEPHPTQLEYLKMVIENLQIKKLFYDNTRGEFIAFEEQGLLPVQMEPVTLTPKNRNSLSTTFDKLVEKRQLEIINDDRLIDQICTVNNNLQAISSIHGHGDAFWSVALATMGVEDQISRTEQSPDMFRKTRSGVLSMFEEGSHIPKGW